MVTTPLLWQSAFTVSPPGTGDAYAPDIVQLADGNIAVAWIDTDAAYGYYPTLEELLFSIYDPLGNWIDRYTMDAHTRDHREVDLVALADGRLGAVYELVGPPSNETFSVAYGEWDPDTEATTDFYVALDPAGGFVPDYYRPIIAQSSTSGMAFIGYYHEMLTTEGDAHTYSDYRMYDPATNWLSGETPTSWDPNAQTPTFEGVEDGRDIASLANGDFAFVGAENGWAQFIVLRIYDDSGVVKLETAAHQSAIDVLVDPAVAGLANGNVVVAWTQVSAFGFHRDIQARVFDNATGNPLSGVINVNLGSAGFQNEPVIAALNDGGFVVFWDDPDGLMGQRYDETGASVGGNFTVANTLGSVEGANLSATTLDDGRVAVTWDLTWVGDTEVQMAIWDPRDEENPGTPGDDLIVGTPLGDSIPLTDGRDHVLGWDGNDTITASFTQGAIYDGGDGLGDFATFDWIDNPDHAGEHGIAVDNEYATWFADDGTVTTSSLIGFEHVIGTHFIDFIWGSEADNVLHGAGGDDTIAGEDGADILNGGGGDDWLNGGPGGWRENTPLGDLLNGNIGEDTAAYVNSDAGVHVNLTTGVNTGGYAEDDTLIDIEIVYGSSHVDLLVGGVGEETLNGYFGDDLLVGSPGADSLNGQQGEDTLYYTGSGAAVTVSLLAGVGFGGHAAGDTLTGFENLTGSSFDDDLTGDTGSNVLDGNAGGDSFNASSGDDKVFGEGGDDLIVGGAGADHLDGDLGVDWVYYSNSDAAVNVSLSANAGIGGHAAGDSFDEVENVYGSVFGDILTGEAGDNTLAGYTGGDTLNGVVGADVLLGGAGDDWLNGGPGDDVLSGYLGADTFVCNLAGFGKDTIIAYQDGVDKFDLNAGLTFADFTVAAAGPGTLLTLTADPTNSIMILGVPPADIDAGDFV